MKETSYVIVLQAFFSCLRQGNVANKNKILYIQSIDISTIKKKIISETWESIHCTPDDSTKDSVNGKEVTEPWQMC